MFRFTELLLTEDGSQIEKKYPVLMQITHVCCEQRDSFYLIYVEGFNEKSYVIPVNDKNLLEQIYNYIATNDDKNFNELNLYAYDDYETDESNWGLDYENREEVLFDSCLKNNKESSVGIGYDSSVMDNLCDELRTMETSMNLKPHDYGL